MSYLNHRCQSLYTVSRNFCIASFGSTYSFDIIILQALQGAAEKDPFTKTSISSKWNNLFVRDFQQLLSRNIYIHIYVFGN